MSDITTLFREAADSIEATPGAALAEADLHRGRRAASRRRARRLAARSSGVVAVGALALLAAAATGTHGSSTANAATLVAYEGTQPAGYTVDTVPDGWTVTTADESYLVIAPPGPAATPVPHTNQSVSRQILVSWQSYTGALPDSTSVRVGAVTGSYGETIDHLGTMDLQYRDAAGHDIVIQVPPELHWSAQQAATFASGITVTDAVAFTGG